MRTELVADALKNAAATTLIETDAIWHSDRNSVYTSAEFRALVTSLGMRSSMGRTGVCWDCETINASGRIVLFRAEERTRLPHRLCHEEARQTRRHAYIEGVLQQPPSALSTRLPTPQRSSLQLPTASLAA